MQVITHFVIVLSRFFCVAYGARWFDYRLMRNPGLVNDTAGSSFECVAKCQSTTGCSAISWSSSTQVCLRSQCNNIDLVKATGWNTYVLNDPYIESKTVAAPCLEWSLTDSCGNTNQGVRAGPNMNLYDAPYSNALSVYGGNAATFSGSTGSYGVTDTSPAVNFPMNNESFSIMFWINYSQLPGTMNLFEFMASGDRDLTIWWPLNDGIFIESVKMRENGSPSISNAIYTIQPSLNSWYHVAFAYVANVSVMALYLNYTLVGMQQYKYTNIFNNWNQIGVGRFSAANSNYFPGALTCVKILNVALNADQVMALGQSCINGKVRFSG